MRFCAIAVLVLAGIPAGPAAAEDAPVVDATPEARALVARLADLLHGPAALSKEPLEVPIHAVVGGKDGAAAVAVTLRMRIDPGGRGLRFDGPPDGDAGRIGKIAGVPAHGSVEFLLGGLLPYPWDSWKGSVDGAGVLHAAVGTEGHWTCGTEMTFDRRGLPISAWCLQPGKDGVLRRGTQARIQWEPAGKRYRMTDVSISGARQVLLRSTFEWGPGEDVLPRRWTVLHEDRITRFRREGEGPPSGGVQDPFMAYHLDPRPKELLERLKGLGDDLLAPDKDKSDRGDLMAVALAAILRAEPSRTSEVVEGLAPAGPGPGRVLLRAIAYSADADLGKSLDQIRPQVAESVRGEADAIRNGLPRPLESPIPMNDVVRGAQALDRCWSLYFVSGDPAALRPIVGALRGLDAKQPGKIMSGEIVGAAARWSLVSNARQVPGIRDCLERDLAVVPPELRPHLELVLEKSALPLQEGGGPAADPSPPVTVTAKPPGPSLDDRLDAVRKLMKDGKWKPALAGLQAVFEDLRGSPEVIHRLPEMEEDLKLCAYRAQEKPPTPEQIFGPGTKSYADATRVLVMEFPKGPVAPPWDGAPPGHANLRIPLEDVTVDYEGSLAERLAVQLSFDFDTDNGYDLRPGVTVGQNREQAGISRLESGKSGKKATVMASCDNGAGAGSHRVRFSLKGGELSIQVDGRGLLSARDTKFPRGFLGIWGFRGGSVSVRGKVDAARLSSLLEACSKRRFQEWTEKSWKRDEAIPDWARQEGK